MIPYYENPYFMNTINGNAMQPVKSWNIVPVQSEAEARAYPLAPGNSMMFKNESAPYLYVKTASYNQMETPTFKKYKLIEEIDPEDEPEVSRPDFEFLKHEVESLKAEIRALKGAE